MSTSDNMEGNAPLNNSNVIRNTSHDQKEILHDIMELYNGGEAFDCDMTASTLKFYERKASDTYVIPEPKLLFDVCPQCDRVKPITPFRPLPLGDGSIRSIVVDLPFVISPKTCPSMMKDRSEGACMIANRFSSWYPYMEAYTNMYWWIRECARVIGDGGIVVYKMQPTVSGSVSHWFDEFSEICAQEAGLYKIDEFYLIAKARLISAAKIKKQQHARKYTSSFLVFKKDARLAGKFSPLNIYRYCRDNVKEGMEWEWK